jgi:ribosomal protein L16 Arg81 hydroxylase
VNHFSAPLTISEFIDQRQLALPFTISHSWRWTPELLRDVVPDHIIEIMSGRDGNPRYEMECDSHKRWMPFHGYLDWIAENPRSNDLYMVANNHFLERWGQALIPDLTTEYTTEYNSTAVFLWLGSAGTVTPLHFDPPDILFYQLYGSKTWFMYPPEEREKLYPSVGVHAEFNPFNPDYDRHPLAREAKPRALQLEAGDALYIPSGWWHAVFAESASISVSFTNLR